MFISDENLSQLILEKGPFDSAKNSRLLDETFLTNKKILQRISRYVPLKNKKVLDIGSSYGQFLIHFEPDSLGLECRPECIEMSKSLGLRTRNFNIEENLLDLNENFDLIFCRQVLDHLVAPHKFLVEANQILKPGGEVLIEIDNIHFFGGYKLPLEHLYGFCAKATEILVQKAGFKIKKIFTITSNKPLIIENLFNKIPFLLNRSQDIYVLGEKVSNFSYESKRIKEFTPSWMRHIDDRYKEISPKK